jgi:hypothetical protein
MASTLKIDTVTTPDGTGNITFSRPIVADGSNLTNLPASGKILQCSSVTKKDVYTSTATSWTDVPDLVISITPASTGNKFLITAHLHGANATANVASLYRITVDGTEVGIGDAGGSNRARVNISDMVTSVSDAMASSSCQFLYTTTGSSAHSIKVQHSVSSGTLGLNRTQGDNSDWVGYARSSSTLTVMEISA